MKALLLKTLVFTGVIVGISNYVIYLKTGRMPIKEWVQSGNWSFDWSADQLAAKAEKMGKGVMNQVSPTSTEPTKVYKWTDADGVVHYGERPAGDGAQEMSIDTEQNVFNAPSSNLPANSTGGEQDPGDQQAPLEKARAAAEALKARMESQEEY
jgi:hypothetical protein